MNLQQRLEHKRRVAEQKKQAARQSTPTHEGMTTPVNPPPSKVLASLMVDNNKDPDAVIIKVSDVVVRPQIRKYFDADALEQLADDIEAHGQDNSIIVRPLNNEQWELVAGERRLRAKEILQKRDPSNIDHQMIRATVRRYDDTMKHLRQLAENIQREQLTPLEEAEALFKAKEESDLTDAALAALVKKSRSYVTRRLELLTLSPELQYLVNRNEVGARPALTQKDKLVDGIVAAMPDGLTAKVTAGELSVLDALKARDTWQEPAPPAGAAAGEQGYTEPAKTADREKPQREISVPVSLEAGEALCELLTRLAADLNLNAIEVTRQNNKTVRKELIAALNGRAREILHAYKTR
ncbi:MAG: parB [Gammaproteobacteria bacterium]|nr:MAG: parB [Gammaproteobacteria bacterium]TND01602.1 MAG: parB [Gammaproteobacteria bacterium]